jgi:hypothetical protein
VAGKPGAAYQNAGFSHLEACFSFMPPAHFVPLSRWLMMSRVGLSRLSGALGVCALVAISHPALAEPRAVVELFTSQGCSSCPAADEILGDLSKDSSIVALSMPIDYWDYLGWKDTLADNRFTARQKAYSQMRGDRDVYTPQVIVNGSAHVIGSDREAIERSVRDTRKNQNVMSVPVSMSVSGSQLNVSVASANGNHPSDHGEIWICAISKAIPIAIGRGENSGREVIYHNVVRSWLKVGDWTGAAGTWAVPMENIARNGVDAAVVYVQDGNRERPGAMLGAAYTLLH